MKEYSGSELLFARPSFAEGWGRIIDFGGTMSEYNTSFTDEEADYYALKSDWDMVGDDLWRAVAMPREISKKL